MSISSISLRTKLLLAFGLCALVSLILGIVGFFNVKQLSGALYEVGVVRLPSLQGLALMDEAETAIERTTMVLLSGDLDRAARQEQYALIAEKWRQADKGWAIYEPLPQTDEEARAWNDLVPAWKAWRSDVDNLVERCKDFDARKAAGAAAASLALKHEEIVQQTLAGRSRLLGHVAPLLDKIVAINYQVAEDAKAQSVTSHADMALVQGLMLGTALAAVLLSILLGIAITRMITQPVNKLVVGLEGIARGDLTVRVPLFRRDEIGRLSAAANDMAESLHLKESELVRLKNYLSNIINSMPAVLVGIDTAHVVTQWNERAALSTGIPAERALGKPVATLLPEFSATIEALRQEVRSGKSASKNQLAVVKNGDHHFYDVMVYPLVANCVQGAVVRIEDVTERTRIQAMMVQTEKMMSVGGLAAGMAHEINNPLGIITQAAQNLERRVSPDLPANRKVADAIGLRLDLVQTYFVQREIDQFIRDIREAATRAAKIVLNMLHFSRTSASTRQAAHLSEVLDRTLELAASDYDLRKHYDFKNIEIVREYGTGVPAVLMTVVEIEQVFLNLIKNAAQAMSANPLGRGPKLTLRLRAEDRFAVVEVEDNGPGMTEAVRQRVFEPFFTTKGPGVGTGLGLSVTYMIVTQNHHGLVSVESVPDHGACFTVKLPLDLDNDLDNDKESA
jgi:PAS domain S-box-containing protein